MGAPGSTRHAADAALALHRCEELLEALDGWAAQVGAVAAAIASTPADGSSRPASGAAPTQPLDWRWIATPGRAGIGPGHAFVGWPEPACRLVAPWAWLRARGAPPAALAGRLQWPAVDVVVAVARLRLERDELGRIEPGGAVLLPPSMRRPWRGRLRGADEADDAGVAIELISPSAARLLGHAVADEPAPPQDDVDGRIACEVRLACDALLPADRLAGWRDDVLPEFGARAELWRCAAPRRPPLKLAGGRLMPWGDGWAMAIEALAEETVCLPA
jgi:hypothetical protein